MSRAYTEHFRIADHGGVVGFTPLTPEAFAWWAENVAKAESWQYLGGALMIDHRCAWRIVDAIAHEDWSNALPNEEAAIENANAELEELRNERTSE